MLATIETLCWAASINGEHYNAWLKIGGKRIQLDHFLTPKEARLLKKKEPDFNWTTKSRSIRFLTEELVIERAIEVVKEECPEVTVILMGTRSLDPLECVYGPEPLKTELNELWKQAEAIEYYDRDVAAMEKISAKWMPLIRPLDDAATKMYPYGYNNNPDKRDWELND